MRRVLWIVDGIGLLVLLCLCWAKVGLTGSAYGAAQVGHADAKPDTKDDQKKRLSAVFLAADKFAQEAAGSTESPEYFRLLEQAMKAARTAKAPAHVRAGPATMGHPAFVRGITSPFASARADALANAAELASLKNDPVWRQNQVKLLKKTAPEHPGRIFGGVPAEPGEFPHCCTVGRSASFCCTGTLIGPNVVLTAGHCVNGSCANRVYFGLDSNSPDPKRIYKVKKAILHEGYNPITLANDVGLLILSENVDGVTPCPIASSAELDAAFALRLAGFGFTETGEFGVLYTADVAIGSVSCSGPGDSGKFGCHLGKELVAGGNGIDSCNGDSGGPAYLVRDGMLYLAGSTSRATSNSVNNCGDGGIYVRTDRYRDWIVKTAAANGGTVP